MKIHCVIDSLGSGGAQRQLTALAALLKLRGHEVRFLVYHPHDHFLPVLRDADIPCQVIPPCSLIRRILAVRRILRQDWQDVVLAFAGPPCAYAEAASIPRQRWGLVVGERAANLRMVRGMGRQIRRLHRFADFIVANSHTGRLLLERKMGDLGDRALTVYNLVDLNAFHHSTKTAAPQAGDPPAPFRIVVAASYTPWKNLGGVAQALHLLRSSGKSPPLVVDWFGETPASEHGAVSQLNRFIAARDLAKVFRLHNATRDIAQQYVSADAVGLFSFFEGLPNAICEGMACGKPILLSNVCDAGSLVREGENGFLCDPQCPESIASAIRRMLGLSFQKRQQMGLASRRMAEHLFSEDRVVERYEEILRAAARRERIPQEYHWPTVVPESAVRTVEAWSNCRTERV